ncbi:type III secretion system gatekeeper subunit SctW [Desulfovibrio piger]|uniref:type III secretion system gatekeeper subunit SctW n=1 Tax=Desulfovibrio piger TaxID=901 RepID=UPI0026EFD01E|nr:type III secretion system gatekeeper subunit SctW [Desulfovibrio piger]
MSIDFSIQHSQVQPTSRDTTASSAVTGSLFGNTATVVESPLSLLAEAAEELTFAVDTTDDFELEERKERDEISEAMEERIKKYQEMMRGAREIQKTRDLKGFLDSRTEKEEALRQLRRFFPDPSEAWAALKDIHEELSAAPDTPPETLRVLNEALEELERTEGPAIRAGINGALNARGFEDLGDAGVLGSFYREAVCHFEDVNSLYDHIQKTYGKDFDAALDFLYKALGSDLAADMPSMETSHLEHVNGSLGELRQLQSARSLCARLLERWGSVHGIRHCPLDDMALLGKVLDLRKERYISGSRISRLAEEAGAPDIERKVLFLQELLNTTRSFAPSLFDGNEGRMRVLDAVQDAVDAAIAEEDAWLAEQG